MGRISNADADIEGPPFTVQRRPVSRNVTAIIDAVESGLRKIGVDQRAKGTGSRLEPVPLVGMMGVPMIADC